MKQKRRLKKAVAVVHGEITSDGRKSERISEFDVTHAESGGTDGKAADLQNPDLATSGGVVEKMPVVLFLEAMDAGEIPAPQVKYDLPVFLQMSRNDGVLRHDRKLG